MKRKFFFIEIVVGIMLLISTNLFAEPHSQLLMGKMSNGKFYYNQTKPLYNNMNECTSIYGGCVKVGACGYAYYYPKLDSIIRGYLRQNSKNAVKFYNKRYNVSCLVKTFI